MDFKCVVPCLIGLESIIADELKMMGVEDVTCENARVLFSGDESAVARANICLRSAERVQILVGEFFATSFEELFEGTKKLEWEKFIGETDAFPVKGYSINSKLFSVRDCQSIIKKAVVERLKQNHKTQWFDESGPIHQIQFSVMKDKVSLLLDTSGAGLHKRGYRPVANDAPIKETIAAAFCNIARLRDFHTLYDPMCGSGTIAIEGAMKACNIASGINRGFSCEKWDIFDEKVFSDERERARLLEKKDCDFVCYASDIDEKALETAKVNAKAAGVENRIVFEKRDLRDFEKRTERGTVIVNPPYGERLLDVEQARDIYRIMGKKFTPERGWSYYIISPDEDFEKLFGKKADKRRKIYNGMIKCQLYMYFK
ncbi:MAG: class I SAM-dependent RNA methyltransferase [Clostridia bacterium]|nr:class I SAM-dependent RNA methyltransferase [Clostridia bacterium]